MEALQRLVKSWHVTDAPSGLSWIESMSVGPGDLPWPPGRILEPAFVWPYSIQAFGCR